MSQCVPSWDVDDNPTPPRLNLRAHSNSNSLALDHVPMLDYEVAELTWENGQLAMHGLGHPRVPNKPPTTSTTTKYTWEKPRAGGTLESIVNQATGLPHRKTSLDGRGDELVPWFDHRCAVTATAAITMDALVPCSNRAVEQPSAHVLDSVPGIDTCVVGCSTRVGSCSGASTFDNSKADEALKRVNGVARIPVAAAHEWSSRDNSASGSATFGMDSRQLTLESCERELGVGGFTSTSMGSPDNTSSGKQCTNATTTDEHDSVCHSRPQKGGGDEEDKKKSTRKSSVSTKRSRAAAIHNQSERKRRDKINQRMKTLQKLVPNSSKTDKASMLDEVIEYLKQLQAQVQMMGRMNMSQMMLPMTLQQQLQMSMMAQIGMGMGMGVGMGVMDMNTIGTGIPPLLHPAAFMPLTSWDGIADRTLPTPATVMPDPMSAFLACQSQPMTMDAYGRMAALYQQLHQPLPPGSKN
ncbi:hypothetical protein F0562_019085 [Nyssa sinensis]|uniref:BHLH domain-containing protein n=1 Tax=Nyssa sinensis TaxID=561372 RepID=A0A5J4ZDW2_9ASTE|nr:hypothetical protein F0562_019085 [Nyssa sinensis]